MLNWHLDRNSGQAPDVGSFRVSDLAPERKNHMRIKKHVRTICPAVGVAVLLTATNAVAVAQAPSPRDPTRPCSGQSGSSCGDHYLESISLNENDRVLTLRSGGDTVDTSRATTQRDLFVPGGSPSGIDEPTACNGVSYGKTVWYDFIPHVNGDVLLQASAFGFNPGMRVIRFDRRTFRPIGQLGCATQLVSGLVQVGVKGARRGVGYSVQIGGVGGTGGVLEFDLNFKPYRVRAKARLRIRPTPTGVQIVSLVVRPSRSARMAVRCRPGCGRHLKRGRKATFRRLGGKRLRAGSRMLINVTRPDMLGTHLAIRITRGSFRDPVERCLRAGSRKPSRRCD